MTMFAENWGEEKPSWAVQYVEVQKEKKVPHCCVWEGKAGDGWCGWR